MRTSRDKSHQKVSQDSLLPPWLYRDGGPGTRGRRKFRWGFRIGARSWLPARLPPLDSCSDSNNKSHVWLCSILPITNFTSLRKGRASITKTQIRHRPHCYLDECLYAQYHHGGERLPLLLNDWALPFLFLTTMSTGGQVCPTRCGD